MNTYLGGSKCSEKWKFLKRMRAIEKRNANIQLITTEKWIKHYKKLLTENQDEYKTETSKEISIQGEPININEETVKRTA